MKQLGLRLFQEAQWIGAMGCIICLGPVPRLTETDPWYGVGWGGGRVGIGCRQRLEARRPPPSLNSAASDSNKVHELD